jgi:hypothetical protein
VLKHASRSRHIDPDRPPAAAGGLRSQFPDLVHGPRELLDCRQLQRRLVDERTRPPPPFRQEVDLSSSVIGTYARGIVNRGTRRSVRVRRDSALRSSTLRLRTCHQYTHSLHVGESARDTDTHDTKHRQTYALLQVATRYADTACIASCTLTVERRGESRAREPWSVLGSAFREGPAAHGEEDHE